MIKNLDLMKDTCFLKNNYMKIYGIFHMYSVILYHLYENSEKNQDKF